MRAAESCAPTRNSFLSAPRSAIVSLSVSADEVMIITESGVIVRMEANTITAQSRTATGVLVQKSATDDALVDVSVVPSDLLSS